MSKFSVKKPLTVFVAVIAILVLGVVASWLFSKLEDRYSDEREAIEASGN